jgi:integrase
MAYVRGHGNRIKVRFRVGGSEFTTTIERTPTKTNIDSTERIARQAEHRLRAGEEWAAVRAWLRGERARAPRSLGYYAQHFLDHADIEHSTLAGYQAAYNRYWLSFDGRSVETISRSELEAHLAGFKVGRKTKKNAISVLRRIFDIAKRDKVITESPTDDWELKQGTTVEPDPYSEIERDKLLAALAPHPIAWRYFLMAFHSGMRTGELLALEWRHLEKPYATVEQSRVRRKLKPSTKTDKPRRVILPPVVWDMLASNPTRFARSFVHMTPEGRAFIDADWLMDHWRDAHRKASVRLRTGAYPWRHTYISLALASGASMIWVAKQAGHDMITMQSRYARWIRGREDADRIEMEKVYGAQTGAQ